MAAAAVTLLDHYLFAVVRPAFNKSVAPENFFDLARRRGVQTKELSIMAGVNFVNRDEVGGVIVKRGQPLFFLFVRPVGFGRGDVVVGLRCAFLEWSGRVHRCEGGGATI